MAVPSFLLGFIPARSGSMRVKDKNARPIAGVSLIERALRQAQGARNLSAVGFSTDSEAYLDLARRAGLAETYRRPPELASDTANTAACVLDYVAWRDHTGTGGFTHVVLLQATSPFRSSADIDHAIEFWRASGRPSLASVTPAAANPRFVVSVDRQTGAQVREGKDERRDFYVLDGGIFIAPLDFVRDTGRFWDENSALFIRHYPCYYDIDTESDFAAAEALLKRGNSEF